MGDGVAHVRLAARMIERKKGCLKINKREEALGREKGICAASVWVDGFSFGCYYCLYL
jgi:hypothetical protein